MKKSIAMLLVLALLMLSLAGCGNTAQDAESTTTPKETSSAATPPKETTTTPAEPEEEPVTVRLGGLKGPTTMGMVKLLDDADKGTASQSYEYTMAAAADELTPKLVQGQLDIVAVPLNLAATLYQNTEGAVQLAAVNTLGVVYIAEKGGETIKSIADLAGKTIYATGKGTTPEYALRYLLSQSGLDMDKDVTMEWKSEPTEVVATISGMEQAVAMLPQPFMTVAQTQLEDIRIAVSLTEAWDALDNGSQFITAGLLVRKAFAEEHPQALATFLKEYAASTAYVNEHPEDAAPLVEQYGIVKAAVAAKAIPYCNIVCITGEEMVTAADGYLQTLYDLNPKAVGGVMPDAGFYLQ